MKKKTLKKPLTFLDKGSRIYRAKLSESDEAGAKYCPFRFYRKTKVETPENFSEACSILVLLKTAKMLLLHIFNICNVNVIFGSVF